MRNTTANRINLATAVRAVADQPAADLTLAELVRAYVIANLDAGGEQRLRKWVDAFGHESAWTLTSERLEVAAQAMVDHGYAPATANRDLSSLGSCYRWAKQRRLTPRGFKSPTVGVPRFDEGIRRVHIEREQLQAAARPRRGLQGPQVRCVRRAADRHRCAQRRAAGARWIWKSAKSLLPQRKTARRACCFSARKPLI